MLTKRIGLLLAAALLATNPAQAWDETGHRVIAYIAWHHMTPEARSAAIEVLKHAPVESDLLTLFPQVGRSLTGRQMEYFLSAAVWPDMVRDRDFPERYERYHRGNWHYINYFWEESPTGVIRERNDVQPAETNIVEQLTHLEAVAASSFFTKAQRAIAVAWLEHLVGDVHQPLHTSGRITESEPDGDQGGNLFKLNGRYNLHGYWDNILDLAYPRRPGENNHAYVERVALAVMADHPASAFANEVQNVENEDWAMRGYALAKSDVYEGVERGQAPPATYREKAQAIAEPAVALAGYRLAMMMNSIFG